VPSGSQYFQVCCPPAACIRFPNLVTAWQPIFADLLSSGSKYLHCNLAAILLPTTTTLLPILPEQNKQPSGFLTLKISGSGVQIYQFLAAWRLR
jgi:hypothetical protein